MISNHQNHLQDGLRTGVSNVPGLLYSTIRCIEHLHAEFLHSAALSCATADIVRASCQAAEYDADVLTSFLPSAPSCFPALIGRLFEDPDMHALIDALREYYYCQGVARALTSMRCARAGDSGNLSTGDLGLLVNEWQAVAAVGLHVMHEFANKVPGTKHEATARKRRRALEQVSSGRAACMADCGLSDLPQLGERRSFTRSGVRTHVFVERGSSLLRLLVTTVSHRGLGVEGLDGAVSGEAIRVLWKPGVSIAAKVTWAGKHGFGLEIVDQSANAHEFVRSLLEAPPQRAH